MGPTPRPAIERAEKFIDRTSSETGCWLWTGALSGGYGNLLADRVVTRAHRVVYEARVRRLREGEELDHLCRNRRCVNPDHLEPVDHAENCRRGVGWSGLNSRKTACPQGHPYALFGETTSAGRRCAPCNREAHRRWEQRRVPTLDVAGDR